MELTHFKLNHGNYTMEVTSMELITWKLPTVTYTMDATS